MNIRRKSVLSCDLDLTHLHSCGHVAVFIGGSVSYNTYGLVNLPEPALQNDPKIVTVLIRGQLAAAYI